MLRHETFIYAEHIKILFVLKNKHVATEIKLNNIFAIVKERELKKFLDACRTQFTHSIRLLDFELAQKCFRTFLHRHSANFL